MYTFRTVSLSIFYILMIMAISTTNGKCSKTEKESYCEAWEGSRPKNKNPRHKATHLTEADKKKILKPRKYKINSNDTCYYEVNNPIAERKVEIEEDKVAYTFALSENDSDTRPVKKARNHSKTK